MAVDNQKLAMSGAIAGAVTPFLLQWAVMPILNRLGGFIPAFSLKLADTSGNTVLLNVRESLTGLTGGFAGWLMDAFGITVAQSTITMIIVSAVGGAILFVVGGYVADMLGLLEGSAVQKTRIVIFTGSVAAGLLLGSIGLPPALNLTLANVLIAMLVNAAILAWLYGVLDEKAKLGLVPF